ncbi:hypothetical protein CBS101457_001053 [Exobasidium rhododendri]|nr:hypothetical protein CBS101457_001053 [Exobasidium rhododendri]
MASEALHVYRHLLRAVPHAVRYQKAATKNIRRIVRDEYENALRLQTSSEAMAKQAGGTLLLYLASSRSKTEPTKENLRARRVVGNLGSLCYHHLSPYTRMQPINKKRRIGGTDANNLRRRRTTQTKKAAKSSSLDSFQIDDSGSSNMSAVVEAQVLPSLVVTPKPIRGPMVHAELRRYRPARWDGQRPIPTIQTTPAFLAHLQATVDATSRTLEETRERFGSSAPATLKVLDRIRQEKGNLKSAKKLKEREDDKHAIMNEAASMLQEVVNIAQTNCGAWLGSSRFTRWAKGDWLST